LLILISNYDYSEIILPSEFSTLSKSSVSKKEYIFRKKMIPYPNLSGVLVLFIRKIHLYG